MKFIIRNRLDFHVRVALILIVSQGRRDMTLIQYEYVVLPVYEIPVWR